MSVTRGPNYPMRPELKALDLRQHRDAVASYTLKGVSVWHVLPRFLLHKKRELTSTSCTCFVQQPETRRII